MIVGHTSGGMPIYFGKSKHKPPKKRPLFDCSVNPQHRLTKNQAKLNKYFCNHCGAPLKARAHMIDEMRAMAETLGFEVREKERF